MKSDKGAISVFALLAMMFFLIFIMVAYNNVAQKGKIQVETVGVLQDIYNKDSVAVYKEIDAGELPTASERRDILLKSEDEYNSSIDTDLEGKYISLLGKIYKLTISVEDK